MANSEHVSGAGAVEISAHRSHIFQLPPLTAPQYFFSNPSDNWLYGCIIKEALRLSLHLWITYESRLLCNAFLKYILRRITFARDACISMRSAKEQSYSFSGTSSGLFLLRSKDSSVLDFLDANTWPHRWLFAVYSISRKHNRNACCNCNRTVTKCGPIQCECVNNLWYYFTQHVLQHNGSTQYLSSYRRYTQYDFYANRIKFQVTEAGLRIGKWQWWWWDRWA